MGLDPPRLYALQADMLPDCARTSTSIQCSSIHNHSLNFPFVLYIWFFNYLSPPSSSLVLLNVPLLLLD